ncbi:UNVERIFIED_CONTAM: hypothetical protein RMT77_005357 [Armadillidium vulgare]
MSLSFYWSLIISHFWETKRSDFWQMLLHHLISAALIIFSWAVNLVRIGSVMLVLFDLADVLLQLTKMCIYIGNQPICNVIFSIFAATWIITRDFIFPFWIMRNTLFQSFDIIPSLPKSVFFLFNSFIIILFLLQLMWTYFILRMMCNTIIFGKIEDYRSSSGEDFLESDGEIGKD